MEKIVELAKEEFSKMENEIKIGKKIFIRNAGKDEYWLQHIIYNDPKVLGLPGNVESIGKEKKQSRGGRLDILLKDTEEKIMYEVEVMLGATDPSHIIRAIEYWDHEKRKFPQRQHYCVLVAESFDRRYFNVIQLMSLNIPMIAIQADLLEVNGERILNFSKIIDIYLEPEETDEKVKKEDESYWNKDSPWTIDNAKEMFAIIKGRHENTALGYTQSYISISKDGKIAYTFQKRAKPTSVMIFKVREAEKEEIIKKILDNNDIGYTYNSYKEFCINVDCEVLKKNAKVFSEIHSLRYKILTESEE